MKKILYRLSLCLIFALGMSLNTQAQGEYRTAIGLRLGSPLSASFKTFFSESSAIEIFGGMRGYSGYGWFNLGAAYAVHKPLGQDIPNLIISL